MNNNRRDQSVVDFHRVAVYVRVSTGRQAREGYSLDDQVAACKSHCESTFGSGNYTCEVFREEGRSGQKRPRQMGGKGYAERRVVSDLVDRIDAGEFTDLVCYEVTRSNRDPYFWYWFKQEVCETNGVTLRFVVGNLNCDDEDDEYFADMQAVNGQREAKMTGRRIRDGRSRALEQGYWPHGQNPWGWTREPAANVGPGQRRRIVPVPERAKWLVHMKDRLLRDGWGLRKIARELQDAGVPSGKTYAMWSETEVYRKLTHPVHAGYIEGNGGNLAEGVHKVDALWDLDTYYQIRAALSSRRPDMSNRHRSEDFPLGGILRCGHCGCPMRAYRSPGNGNRFYRCGSRIVRGGEDCPGVMKKAEHVEACVLEAIRDFACSPKMRQLVGEEAKALLSSRQDELRAELKSVTKRLSEKEDQLVKLTDAFTKGLMDEVQFATVSARWREEQAALRTRQADIETRVEHGIMDESLLGSVRTALGRFEQTWDQLEPRSRQELLRGLLETVELKGSGEGLVLTVKLFVLPAIEYLLPEGRDGAMVIPELGAITDRQLALLAHVLDGREYGEIAQMWNTNRQNVNTCARRVRKQCGVDDIHELARRAQPLIDKSRAWLPLDGRVRDQDLPREVRLSPRQLDVLEGYAAGKGRKQIAEELGVTPTTVSVRTSEFKQKLGKDNIEDSITRAQQLGLLSSIA